MEGVRNILDKKPPWRDCAVVIGSWLLGYVCANTSATIARESLIKIAQSSPGQLTRRLLADFPLDKLFGQTIFEISNSN
ncbi:unnamed protein product [Caenorhabditis auriculariae]|uniref:Uncharacterized protein n=1 Tax=Caenorhabditis auriculariae TaxID=2777116 RepID=A0A8S1HU87_9PELO|nr:unnamed protein product [Caenorhabditis auriculariae]